MSAGPTTRSPDLDTLDKFVYKPLKHTHWLRILKLRSAPVGQPTIDCVIEEVPDLKTYPPGYEAVSWCWGTGRDDQSIRVHNGEKAFALQVYEHLYEALLALRKPDRDRSLWIDALCINQKDVEERNRQVPRMTEIYSGATNVCIWLGKADTQSDMALKFIREKMLSLWSFDKLCDDKEHVDSWAALLELMKRPWFSRRWVVQEVALAKAGTVHCGHEHVSWQEFADAVSLLVEVDTAARKLSELVRKEERFSYAQDFFQEVPFLGATLLVNLTGRLLKRAVSDNFDEHHRSMTLEQLVGRLAVFETSEPRDTIYAVLALAKDSQPSIKGISTHIDGRELTFKTQKALAGAARRIPNPYRRRYVVDYNQPIVDVYQQFIAFSISRADHYRALDIICRPFARSYTKKQDLAFDQVAMDRLSDAEGKKTVTLPSWIPNVTEVPFVGQRNRRKRTEDGDTEVELFSLSMERHRGDPFVGEAGFASENYSAAGTRKYDMNRLRFRKRRDHYSMFAEGFVLDTVATVEAASQFGSIPASWWSLQKGHDWETFWRTLVADRSSKGQNPPVYYQRALREALGLDKNAFRDSFNTNDRIEHGGSTVLSEVLRRVRATIWERCLIETERKFLGLAPSNAKGGDFVCILYGCSVPVIMRKTTKSQIALEEEAEDDDTDHAPRFEKAKLLLQKSMAARLEKLHPGSTTSAAYGEANGRGGRGSVTDWKTTKNGLYPRSGDVTTVRDGMTWLYRVLRQGLKTHPWIVRVAILSLLASLFTVLQEPVTAATITLTILPHLIFDLYRGITAWIAQRNQGNVHNEDATASLLVLGSTLAIVSTLWRRDAYLVLAINAVYLIIFPEIYPEKVRALLLNVYGTYAKGVRDQTKGSSGATYRGENKSAAHSKGFPPSTKRAKPRPGDGNANRKPRTDYYTLIGECYIHGMMNGHAIEWQNQTVGAGPEADRVKAEIFEIR
ncbi:hypothetical protein LTR17_008314 [Elasticomyces elasticus]|nr:hypothetical protein LTR17_008314 [Elasticomyces elasticus]